MTGGALSFSCGLHVGSPLEGVPTCLLVSGGSLQDGKLQWPADPVKFFVSGPAVKSLKVGHCQCPDEDTHEGNVFNELPCPC